MGQHVDRDQLLKVIAGVFTEYGIDPTGSRPVPFDSMAPIARRVREEMNLQSDDEIHECLDLLIPEMLDRTMTEAGKWLAIQQIAKGLGLHISRPS